MISFLLLSQNNSLHLNVRWALFALLLVIMVYSLVSDYRRKRAKTDEVGHNRSNSVFLPIAIGLTLVVFLVQMVLK